MPTISEIESRALALSVDERIRLTLALWRSIEDVGPGTSEDWDTLVAVLSSAHLKEKSSTKEAELALATR